MSLTETSFAPEMFYAPEQAGGSTGTHAGIGELIERCGREVLARTHALTGDVAIRARPARRLSPAVDPDGRVLCEAAARALEAFRAVASDFTVLDPASPLQRANAMPEHWHIVPRTVFAAVAHAHAAHWRTCGRFDPRTSDRRSAPGEALATTAARRGSTWTAGSTGSAQTAAERYVAPWHPRLRHAHSAVHLGGTAVELGGVGHALAIRWASEALSRVSADYLVEAGSHSYCAGRSPDGGPWLVAIDHPFGGPSPIAVVGVSDMAVATAAAPAGPRRLADVRGTRREPGRRPSPTVGAGLRAVTVVADDPAWAEVWSRVLLREGASGIAVTAERRGIGALWVDEDGAVSSSRELRQSLLWQAS